MASFPLLCQVVMSGASRDKLNDLPNDFVKQIKTKECDIIVKAFLQMDFRTCGIQAPRLFQLECAITLKMGQDLMCTGECCSRTSMIADWSLNSMRNSGVRSFIDIWNTCKESISLLTLLSTISSAQAFTHRISLSCSCFSA